MSLAGLEDKKAITFLRGEVSEEWGRKGEGVEEERKRQPQTFVPNLRMNNLSQSPRGPLGPD